MKTILLTQDQVALVDNEDFSNLSKYSWCVSKHRNTSYAQTWKNGKSVRMHQLIMGKKTGFEIDHINNNGLDNRKKNLRFATHSQNLANARIRKRQASSYRGVYYSKEKKKWRVLIGIDYSIKFVGYFKTQEEAALAYNKKAKEIFGEFACLNPVIK